MFRVLFKKFNNFCNVSYSKSEDNLIFLNTVLIFSLEELCFKTYFYKESKNK